MREGEGRQNEVFGKLVDELDMSVRAANTLAKLGVRTIGDLVEKCTAHRLRDAVDDPTKADRVIQEVRDLLADIGFELKEGEGELNEAIEQNESTDQPREAFSRSVDELDMSVRTANTLARLNVGTIGDLVQNCTVNRVRDAVEDQTRADLVIDEVRGLLAELGLTLKDE